LANKWLVSTLNHLVHWIIFVQQNKIENDNKNENNFIFLTNMIKTRTSFFKDFLFIWTSIFFSNYYNIDI